MKSQSIVFYRCRWCGVVYEQECRSMPRSAILGAIKKSMDPKSAQLITIHECDAGQLNGRRGVADLIGAREPYEYSTT